MGTFLFTGVVEWTAIVGHRLTQRLTDAELDPAVVVFIESRRCHFSTFELVIKSVGRGAARNVKFRSEPGFAADADRTATRLLNMAIFERGIPFPGPSQETRTYYGSFRRLEAAPLALHVTYERDPAERRRKTLQADFTIDVRIFDGTMQVGEQPEVTSAKALKQIADDVRGVRRGGPLGPLSVSPSRRYVFSQRINRFWNRWSGTPYIDSGATGWHTFRTELWRTLVGVGLRLRKRAHAAASA